MIPPASTNQTAPDCLDEADAAALREAVRRLESIRWQIRLAHYIGKPIDVLFNKLPQNAVNLINQVTHEALTRALDVAVWSLGKDGKWGGYPRLEKAATTITGAAGGFFGLAGLAVEMPISTSIMLRSIADSARAEGEKIGEIEARLECLAVFAYGSPSPGDDAAESAYFAIRSALAQQISAVIAHLSSKNMAGRNAPILAMLIRSIASRFGIAVSEKVAAQALPIVGAVGGAAINLIFIDHFQEVARGHFAVRRLERKYADDVVRRAYQKIREQQQQENPSHG